MNQLIEFKVGDKVTFKPYEIECKCTVKGVQHGMWKTGLHMNGEPDDRIFYVLKGEADSVASGISIMESKLFGQREYKIIFNGRKNGALGITYPITDYRMAATSENAVKALYDEYEHISQATAVLN